MNESHNGISVLESLIDSAPEGCLGCETLFANCTILARKVVDHSVTLEQAQVELQTDIGANCRGRISRFAGWGQQSYRCTYEVPLGPIGVTLVAEEKPNMLHK